MKENEEGIILKMKNKLGN